jgi:hypothetical protein
MYLLILLFILVVTIFQLSIEKYIREKRRKYVGKVLREIVDQNKSRLVLFHWFFQMHWRKIHHRMYVPDEQLRRLIFLMRSFPMKKVARIYIRIHTIVKKECPMLSFRNFEALQDFSKAGTIKKILREISLIFPRIQKYRERCKSALVKKQNIIPLLDQERQEQTSTEINSMVKILHILDKVESKFNDIYQEYLYPIHVALKRSDGDTREHQKAKTDRMEKLAIIWIAISRNIVLKQFNFYIRIQNTRPQYEKECDGIGKIEKTNETIVLEVKTSWDAVTISMERKNAIDMQLKTIEDFGFSKSMGIIIGKQNPDWLTYNGQRVICSSLTTYLASNVDKPGHSSQMSDILNDMRESTFMAKKKVESILSDDRIVLVEQEDLLKLLNTIQDMYKDDRKDYPIDSFKGKIMKYAGKLFELPFDTWEF